MAWATLHLDSRPLRKLPKRRLFAVQLGVRMCSTLNATFGNGSLCDTVLDGGVDAVVTVDSGNLVNASNVLSPALGLERSYTGLLKLKPVDCVLDPDKPDFDKP